jgi:LysR family transcriptional regulator, regulator of abg operon
VHLAQLRYFVAIVDAGSIRAAARQLGISQPAATKALRALEQDLDSVLVQRSSRGILLTAAGKAFLARARAIQAQVHEAREELARLSGAADETVRVGVASVIGPWLVPPALARFRADHPDTIVRIVEGTQETLLPALREGTLDFAICLRLEAESTRAFTVRPFARFRLTVVARKGHPLCHARTLETLKSSAWLMSRPRGSSGVLEHAFQSAGLALPTSATECDSHAIKVALLASTDALGLLAKPMLAEPAVAALLQEIPLDKPLPLLTCSLYTRADSRPGPAAKALAAALAWQSRTVLRASNESPAGDRRG